MCVTAAQPKNGDNTVRKVRECSDCPEPELIKYGYKGCPLLPITTEKCDVIAIDEIGPMELYSQKFKQAVEQALGSKKLVLAVVHGKAKDPLITKAKAREDAKIFTVTDSNRNGLPQLLKNQLTFSK